jgi:CDGSH-type Zn-finger protein
MDKPIIAQKHSYKLELSPGHYLWCSCGLSSTQPFCDDSHKSTEFKPVEFEIIEQKIYSICGCKHSAKGHICDGTHKNLEA